MTPTDVDWFLDGERARGASPATLRSYGADLRTYAAWLEGRAQTPATATRADVRAYASDLAGRGLAPASRARALAALRSLHRRLLTAGRATADPAAELPARSASAGCPTPRASRSSAACSTTPGPTARRGCATVRRSSCCTGAACG